MDSLLIVGAIIVALAAFAVLFKVLGKKTKGDLVLFVGNVGAGKTALFYRLAQGVYRETHTSLKENELRFHPVGIPTSGKANYRYVDFPGHGSQRFRLQHFLSQARALVVVVDATDDLNLPQLASLLYSLLTDASLVSRRVPLFVAVAKSDAPSAKSAKAVIAHLEDMLEKSRHLQSSLPDLDPTATNHTVELGKKGQPFTFEQSPLSVKYGAVSAKDGNVQPLLDFINLL